MAKAKQVQPEPKADETKDAPVDAVAPEAPKADTYKRVELPGGTVREDF